MLLADGGSFGALPIEAHTRSSNGLSDGFRRKFSEGYDHDGLEPNLDSDLNGNLLPPISIVAMAMMTVMFGDSYT